MPTIFQANLDGSESIRYFHVSLFAYYLRQAHVHAGNAYAATEVDSEFKESLLSILFSALSAEAFVNEMAEEKLHGTEIAAFHSLQNKYKRTTETASITWKVKLLFELYWQHSLAIDTEPLVGVERLSKLRNALVHYKLHDSAGKAYMPPPKTIPVEGGGFLTGFNFMQSPTRVEPPLVSRLNRRESASCFNAVLRVAKLWNQCAGAQPNSLTSISEFELTQ